MIRFSNIFKNFTIDRNEENNILNKRETVGVIISESRIKMKIYISISMIHHDKNERHLFNFDKGQECLVDVNHTTATFLL